MSTETLRCRCGREVRIVRLGRSLLSLGHWRNPGADHHPVQLAPASRSAAHRSHHRAAGQGMVGERTGVARPTGTPEPHGKRPGVL